MAYRPPHITNDSKVFNDLLKSQEQSKRAYGVLHFRSSKVAYICGDAYYELKAENPIEYSELDRNKFIGFIAAYRKSINNYIVGCNFNIPKIDAKFDIVRKTNFNIWAEVKPGEYFHNIDISHCYWQLSHRLTYISDRFYNKYQKREDYKQAKRLCTSFLGSEKQMEYTLPKNKTRKKPETFVVKCDNTLFNQVYVNIRNLSSNIIQECCDVVGGKYIEKNIDAISVKITDGPFIKEYLRSQGIIFKDSICLKVNENQYSKKAKIKNIINPLKIV